MHAHSRREIPQGLGGCFAPRWPAVNIMGSLKLPIAKLRRFGQKRERELNPTNQTMSQTFTFKAPRTITFTCGDVPKLTAAFLLIDRTEEPFPPGFLDAAAKAIQTSKSYLHRAKKLKRYFNTNRAYRDAMRGAVESGEMSVQAALTAIKAQEALQKKASGVVEPKKPRRPVYRTICGWPEGLSEEKLQYLESWLGVARSTITDAMALRVKLARDPALFGEWHGRALTEEFQPRAILERIKKAEAAAAAHGAPAKPPAESLT